ncbi:hypothetical protein CSC70_00540 [Pseudoxanthomonas kalamensis DSM 18571]|uniref:hypothetical protein n=1 Tax=Pseudoxanthomonas kalamensis TaxID=289483 RepID=UPI0013917722|nr:hypothetical protein [Pseudoxanthomonas kalamensis]KAF1712055.1 hypothetical protein CSC70_00540 [Pseudoxanthomonas kalamensis DSM 18571]
MHRRFPKLALMLPILAATAALAATSPEIERGVGTPQAVGVAHTLRQIPEACAVLQGVFTGDAAAPYRFVAARSHPQCQPRAQYVDFGQAQPAEAKGWKLNDVIRVPSTDCPSRQAVVRVWRLPRDNRPDYDGQGQARVYLQEAKETAAAGKLAAVTQYAAQLSMEGKPCR